MVFQYALSPLQDEHCVIEVNGICEKELYKSVGKADTLPLHYYLLLLTCSSSIG